MNRHKVAAVLAARDEVFEFVDGLGASGGYCTYSDADEEMLCLIEYLDRVLHGLLARDAMPYPGVSVCRVERLPGGVAVVVVPCSDAEEFAELSGALQFEGEVYGKSGWNSDSCEAFFRSDSLNNSGRTMGAYVGV